MLNRISVRWNLREYIFDFELVNLLKNDASMSLKSNEKHRKRPSGTPPLNKMNNGFSTGEEDSRGPTDQICCLIEDGESCRNAAGNASYSKRIQKTVTQRRLKLNIDPQVMCFVKFHHNTNLRLSCFCFIESSGSPHLHLRLPQGTNSVCPYEATT